MENRNQAWRRDILIRHTGDKAGWGHLCCYFLISANICRVCAERGPDRNGVNRHIGVSHPDSRGYKGGRNGTDVLLSAGRSHLCVHSGRFKKWEKESNLINRYEIETGKASVLPKHPVTDKLLTKLFTEKEAELLENI